MPAAGVTGFGHLFSALSVPAHQAAKLKQYFKMGNNTSHSHPYAGETAPHGTSRSHRSNDPSSSTATSAAPGAGSSKAQQAPATPSPPLGPPLPPIPSTFVDGGFLLPLSNVYPASPQDWAHPVVQHLILSRRLAPFYRGLEDWEESWSHEEVASALNSSRTARLKAVKDLEAKEKLEKEEAERVGAGRKAGKSKEGQGMDAKGKREAAEAVGWDVRAREAERYLGQTAECPLCFLYYPPNINVSRCCEQPICTECFVQIKRADPTPQELKSDPVSCPYCVESNFGVTYEPPPPPRRTDWEAAASLPVPGASTASSPTDSPGLDAGTPNDPNASAISTTSYGTPSSINALGAPGTFAERSRRRKSTSHMSPQVVTIDAIQADWQIKLEAVKAAVQRRANRRIIFRQEGDRLVPVGVTSSRDPMGQAYLGALGRNRVAVAGAEGEADAAGSNGEADANGSRRTRRNRGPNYGVDLEELMVMEAMRLSLMEEEERQKKERLENEKKEKEAKKAEKERAKEEKKAAKGKHRLGDDGAGPSGSGPGSGHVTPVGSTSTASPAAVPIPGQPSTSTAQVADASKRRRSSSAVRDFAHGALFHASPRHSTSASGAGSGFHLPGHLPGFTSASPPTIPTPEPEPVGSLERQISDAMGGPETPGAGRGEGLAAVEAARLQRPSDVSRHSSFLHRTDSMTPSSGDDVTSPIYDYGEYQPLIRSVNDDTRSIASSVLPIGGPSHAHDRQRAGSIATTGTANNYADSEFRMSLEDVSRSGGSIQIPRRGSSVKPDGE